LVEYNPLLLKKISKPSVERISDSLFISKNGFLSLDIFESPLEKDESKTLYGCLNKCKTAMGRRSLRKWIQHPLIDLAQIQERQDKVQQFLDKKDFLNELREVYDISRLTRRLALRNLMPHEIVSFNNSIALSQAVLAKYKIANQISKKTLSFIETNIDLALVETNAEEYAFFKGSLEENVLEERSEWQSAKSRLEKRTKELSKLLATDKLRISMNKESIQLIGPKSLHVKCKENGVSFKIKASDLQVDDEKWEELASKEFYLKRKFTIKAEKEWCNFQTSMIENFGEELLDYANLVGEVDVLSNFAQLSFERNYSKPVLKDTDKPYINMKKMRHPVVEQSKDLTETFISNDLSLDQEKNLMVIYGANSAGKSTILKSLAVNIIMAQIGCYIPANEGSELSIFDSIMTRMTTYDSLSEGLSTFTMEMIELQSALSKYKERALFLFDEIGRGTSVDDGEAIAFATLEFLRPDQTNSITLFSTHYHSLYENIKNFDNIIVKHMSGRVSGGTLSFSRILKDGPGEGSYGIMVAKSCGLPESIIRVAENYNKEHRKLMVSRYNTSIEGTLCEFCNIEQSQETHHLIEQHQGKVEKIVINGTVKDIHDKGNLVLLCATCHTKITNHKIKITKEKILGKGANHFELVIEDLSQKETK
jgi:DNA mismatch repair protein MutS